MSVSRWDGITRETLEQLGVTWPDKHPDTGEPFADVKGFAQTAQIQRVERLPIGYPDRKVAIAWETAYYDDGEWCEEYQRPTEWRDLTDEEWAGTLAAYEREKDKTTAFVSAGPDIIEGHFEAASGSWARGLYDTKTKAWFWTETATCFRHGR